MKSMTIVILVRHGSNSYVRKGKLAGRKPGVNLNKKGRKQSASVAKLLKHAPVSAVYSSPLERTMETAIPIAEILGLDVIPRKGLIEIDFGDWQNQKIKKLRQLEEWKIVQLYPSRMEFPRGEGFNQAQLRVVTEIGELVEQHDDKDVIVCVSHADVIKLAVAYFIGMPIDLFQRLHISPGSISALYISKSQSQLLTLNYETSFSLIE